MTCRKIGKTYNEKVTFGKLERRRSRELRTRKRHVKRMGKQMKTMFRRER